MAKICNYGDPFTEKISIRLSKGQLSFVNQYSQYHNFSPSHFFRSLLDSFIYSSDMEIQEDENENANIDHLV